MGKKSRVKKERKISWEQGRTKNEKTKSNTPIVFIPILIMFAVLAVLDIYTNIPKNQSRALFFFMFGYLFIGIPVAQIRSGYFWRNLKEGNRGKHKSESPVSFALSNIIYTILGLCFWGYSAICLFLKNIK
jgi:hypothetical protein